jgi:hypothetical protein
MAVPPAMALAADRLRARVEELERRGASGEEVLALKLMVAKPRQIRISSERWSRLRGKN